MSADFCVCSHQHGAARAGDGNGFVRESKEIGGKEPRA